MSDLDRQDPFALGGAGKGEAIGGKPRGADPEYFPPLDVAVDPDSGAIDITVPADARGDLAALLGEPSDEEVAHYVAVLAAKGVIAEPDFARELLRHPEIRRRALLQSAADPFASARWVPVEKFEVRLDAGTLWAEICEATRWGWYHWDVWFAPPPIFRGLTAELIGSGNPGSRDAAKAAAFEQLRAAAEALGQRCGAAVPRR